MKDAFLSHASCDKPKVVDFANELARRNITYWLDEGEIKWGDRITKRINDGLREARFVIVFLSEAFVGRNWPEAELGSAIARENAEGETVVLPIIIGDPIVVLSSYPLLREKAYLRWDLGITRLADHLQENLVAIRPQREEPSAWDRRHALLDLLSEHQKIFKNRGCSEEELTSIRLRISDPRLSQDVISTIVYDFVSGIAEKTQRNADWLHQVAERDLKLRGAIAKMESRASIENGVFCCRECVPINFSIIDFYADAAGNVSGWIEEFLNDRTLARKKIFDRDGRTTNLATNYLVTFLSSKMAALVEDWKTTTLRDVIKSVVARLVPHLSRVANDLYAAVQEEIAKAELPPSGLRIPREANISSAALIDWMVKKVTTTWLTLFSNTLYLDVSQMLGVVRRANGTPQERLHAALVTDILLNGEQQELSFFNDLTFYVNHNFLYLDIDSSTFVDRKKLSVKLAQSQMAVRELQEVALAATALINRS